MNSESPQDLRGVHWARSLPASETKTTGRPFPLVNLILFLATLASTMAAGAIDSWNTDLTAGVLRLYRNPTAMVAGLPYATALMAILGSHEMGHYLASKYHGVKASLPYFLPAPHYFGTFGAFIRMKSPLPDRKTLFDIAVAGPLAGFAVAVPITLWGLSHSRFVSFGAGTSTELGLGPSLLFMEMARLTLGASPGARGIELHPLAVAGWLGFFVTALNLLPIGQLDGGHLIYSLMQKRYRLVSWATIVVLLPLGYFWPGWIFWAILVSLIGLRHPTPLDSWTPLGGKRRWIGAFTLMIFILTFAPVPFLI